MLEKKQLIGTAALFLGMTFTIQAQETGSEYCDKGSENFAATCECKRKGRSQRSNTEYR